MARTGTVGWYAARLGSMSPAEVAWRAASAATLPIRSRSRRLVTGPRWEPVAPLLTAVEKEQVVATADGIAGGTLELWGRPMRVDLRRMPWDADPFDGGPLPPVSWRRWGRDAKPTWELHRQQHLVPLAVGAELAGRSDWKRLALDQVLDWIARNPVGSPYAWPSGYEGANRLVTWALAVPFLAGEATAAELQTIGESFAAHVRFVAARPSRFSSANNHRLAELTGLLAAARLGLGRWDPLWRELEEQVVRQTYADGGSREQAGGYFLYVLELLSVCALLAQAAGRPLGRLDERLRAMLRWLDAVADDEGEPPPVGDDAEDRMLRLDYYEPRRAAVIAARARGLLDSVDTASALRSTLLPASGYAVLRAGGTHVVFDVGELGFGALAAHGHADALSVLVRGAFRDSGTGTYSARDGRDAFRVTAAHNTVIVDGRSQADPLGPHLWGRRYRVALEGSSFAEGVEYVRASHDGYAPARHTRSVALLAPDLLVVLDRVRGPEPVAATLTWHPEGEPSFTVAAVPDAEPRALEAPWSPRYLDIRSGRRLTWTATGRDVVFATVVALGGGERPTARLTHDDGVTTLVVEAPRRLRLTERWAGPTIESEG